MQTRDPSSPSSVEESWSTIEPEDFDPKLAEPVSAPLLELEQDSLIGTTLLDTYQVVRVLGEGGMGRIYEAHHMRIKQKRFAIKVLRPEFVGSAQIRARFEREMQAVARVTHPGVLAIVDVGQTALGWSFMVSEHLSGLDLLAYLKRFGALSNDRVIEMGCRVAEALEATHAQGVIHRDVKPSNVFLLGAFEPLGPEWDGVKLIDFGLSRFTKQDDELSKSGLVMGTPAYMAPEQARGSRTDHLTDVYGVGAILYAAATGVPPFREETQQQTLVAAMSREPVRPRERNPSISEGLEVVIQRAMSKEPEHRHPSMSALRLALSNLAPGSPRTHHAVRPRRPEVRLQGVRTSFVALASFAIAVCLVMLANALAGLLALSLVDVTLTASETALLALALGTGAGLLLLWLLRTGRAIWANSAKLMDRLPRLRAPLVAGVMVYGLGSLALRFGHEVLPQLALEAPLAGLPGVAWPGWSVLLSAAALLGAAGVAVHQRYWHPLSMRQRWVWGPLVAAGALLVGLVLTRTSLLGQFGHPGSDAVNVPGSESGSGSSLAPFAGSSSGARALAPSAAGDAGAPFDPREATRTLALEASGSGAAKASDDAGTLAEPALARSESGVPGVAAPAPGESATAASLGTAPSSAVPSSAAPSNAAPASPEASVSAVAPLIAAPGPVPAAPLSPSDALKARAVEQSQRATEMLGAVQTLERLIASSPDKAGDPVVRDILARAARLEGDASRAAFHLMSNDMGSKGPDLLYELMLSEPALAERAKYQLTRYRVRRLFSQELSIAYDLRFTGSCGSRVAMLDRANEFGDQRSVDTLAILLGKPEKCVPGGPLDCLPHCTREAAQLTRSLELITRRMRARERAASSN